MNKRRKIASLGAALAVMLVLGGTAVQAQLVPPPRGTPVPPPRPRAAPAVPPPLAEPATPQQRERWLLERGGTIGDIAAETRGATIVLGGRNVQLPPDSYVDGVVTHVTCGPVRPCPETPFYNIVRGRSRINVEVRSGRIISEHTAPGEDGAFAFLKEALR